MDKKECGMLIIKSILSSLLGSVLIYLCLTLWNNELVKILNSVSESKSDALNLVFIIFPILFIINLMTLLGNFVAKQGTNGTKQKKTRKK